MGYEITLIIGTSCGSLPKDKTDFHLLEIASIDLCKSVFKKTWIDEEDRGKTISYSEAGTGQLITKDLYGDSLHPIDPKKILNILIKENEHLHYRRYDAAIPLLKSLISNFSFEPLTCILWGH